MELFDIKRKPKYYQHKRKPINSDTFPLNRSIFYLLFLNSFILIFLLLNYIYIIISKTPHALKNKDVITLISNSQIEKPLTDTREYSIIQLYNKLEAVLISDKNATKSGFSISIDLEPTDKIRSGELTQRILINNTNNGQSFISSLNKYYGDYHISTLNGIYNFYCDFDSEGLNETMSNFYQMNFNSTIYRKVFSPRDQYYIEMTLITLKNEYQKYLNDYENSLPLYIFNELLLKEKNLKSTEISNFNSLKSILKYFDSVPNRIKLSVISNYTIIQMREIINDTWSNINIEEDFIYNTPIYNYNEELAKQIYIKSKKGNIYTFAVLCRKDLNDKHNILESLSIYEYISYMVNDYGDYSIFKELKNKGMIYNISSKVIKASISSPNYFTIQAELTDYGIDNIDMITGYILAFIDTLKREGKYEGTYSNIASINNKKFKFLTIDKYWSYLKTLSSNLLYHNSNNSSSYKSNLKNILYSAYNMPQFNAERVKNAINSVKDFNNIIVVLSLENIDKYLKSKSKCNQTSIRDENYYICNINITSVEDKAYEKSYKDIPFKLKEENKYMTKIDYIETPKGSEEEINREINSIKAEKFHQGNRTEIWVKLDRTFKVPRVQLYILFNYFSQESFNKYKDWVHKSGLSKDLQIILFLKIKQRVKTLLYDAELSGNSIDMILNYNSGFTIKISAYQDVIISIFKTIIEIVRYSCNKSTLSPKEYELVNAYNSQDEYLTDILSNYYFIGNISKSEINKLKYIYPMFLNRQIHDFHGYFLEKVYSTVLLYGVINGDIKYTIKEEMEANFEWFPNKDITEKKITVVNRKCDVLRMNQFSFNQNAISTYVILDLGDLSIRAELFAELYIFLWKKMFKDKTIVEKVIIHNNIFISGKKGYVKEKKSDVKSPFDLNEEIKGEMGKLYDIIKETGEDEFNYYKEVLKRVYRRKPLRLKLKADKAWFDIIENKDYYEESLINFGLSKIDSIKKEYFVKYFEYAILNNKFMSFEFYSGEVDERRIPDKENFALRNEICDTINLLEDNNYNISNI